ncbi:MAG TPA: hypothetical protein VFD30_02505 [Terriglobia bacterium]|jgi:hypothetical protein|nr:hypothetical protein [Terriglobia bacterium]
MSSRRCRYCQQVFQPAPYHPQQQVCSQPACQGQRQRDYHRRKIRSDPLYAQVVRESHKKWRDEHPDYQKRYRQTHAQAVERNRQQQHFRDQGRRLQKLVKNNLAVSQLLILQPVEPFPTLCEAADSVNLIWSSLMV